MVARSNQRLINPFILMRGAQRVVPKCLLPIPTPPAPLWFSQLLFCVRALPPQGGSGGAGKIGMHICVRARTGTGQHFPVTGGCKQPWLSALLSRALRDCNGPLSFSNTTKRYHFSFMTPES